MSKEERQIIDILRTKQIDLKSVHYQFKAVEILITFSRKNWPAYKHCDNQQY